MKMIHYSHYFLHSLLILHTPIPPHPTPPHPSAPIPTRPNQYNPINLFTSNMCLFCTLSFIHLSKPHTLFIISPLLAFSSPFSSSFLELVFDLHLLRSVIPGLKRKKKKTFKKMSLDMTYSSSSERVCYVRCNFCNTILAVNVPCNSMMTVVTVRCGHCSNLLSVNIGPSLQSPPLQNIQQRQNDSSFEDGISRGYGSSSSSTDSYHRFSPMPTDHDQPRSPPIRLGTFPSYPLWTQAGWQ
ncbi:uncharacterized protein LOC129901420 isoform X3 [Solanum dulcamara]|uniref:uncharacterized protein LOC129901420 isoform X3 n=1 Tax=Solanum dulcamara TaxID=45834 RepID=UPI00248560C4|nr:uncharacterized protein LOC129901420 isoform X3 [Solanum dulcamara]